MEYLCQKINVVLKCNNSNHFETNESLVLSTLCSSDSLKCIEQTCKKCGPKMLDAIKSNLPFCSPECKNESESCQDHIIPVQQYKQKDYQTNKGETKKKLYLITQHCTMIKLVKMLKTAMYDFPRHHFKEVFHKCKQNLCKGQILKVQDFSKKYKCLIPDEARSLHWLQKQATLYPVVIYRKESGNIIEEQLVYISDDLHHNSSFVVFK